jgi:hypothetical protein
VGENMFNELLDAKYIIHHEFEPEKYTVNGRIYKEVNKRSIAQIRRVTPEFKESGSRYYGTASGPWEPPNSYPNPKAVTTLLWRKMTLPSFIYSILPLSPTCCTPDGRR